MHKYKPHIGHFLILLFAITAHEKLFPQGSWESMALPSQQDMHSVFFTDSLKGWVAGDSGIILHTQDGGLQWEFQNSTIIHDIYSIYFQSDQLGWAAAVNYSEPPYGTVLLKTYNGGNDWISYPYPEENIFINCIHYLDSLNGWMGGSPHALVHTQDGGESWQQASIDTSTLAFFPVLSIQFYNEQYGYASGGIFDIAGVCWHTHDGGEHWSAIDVSQAPADEVHQLHLFDSLHIMGAGGDPDFGYGVGLIRSWDGGLQWSYDEVGIQGNAVDLDFVNAHEVWAPLGPRNKFIYSTDTGQVWTEIDTPESMAIFDVMFPDEWHGYAVGYEGGALRFIPDGSVGTIEFIDHDLPIQLHQNYPNPFHQQTTIAFHIGDAHQTQMSIELILMNSGGQKIRSLFYGDALAGKYQVLFDASGLPKGLYYSQLLVNGMVIDTKSMLLIDE